MLRYEIYDDAGNLAFTSTKPGLQLDHEMSEVPQGDDDPKVSIYNRSGTAVSHFAVLTIPIRMSGHLDGTLLVYLDQSEQAKMLSRYFGLIAAVTMLLLGAGVATPIALAWTRSREKRRAEERLRYLENYDPLTGFPNRNAFDGLLNTALANMQRKRTHIAVLCVDIGKFNEISDDTAAGDTVLREMGERIRSKLRPGDFAARRSIDEFAVALVDIGNLAEVMAFTDRLVDSLAVRSTWPTRSSCAPRASALRWRRATATTPPCCCGTPILRSPAPRPTAGSACAASSQAWTRRSSGGA